jgi:hypothetical protein
MKRLLTMVALALCVGTTIQIKADFNDVVGPTVGGAALGGIFGGRRGAGIGAGVGLGVGILNSSSNRRGRPDNRPVQPVQYVDYDDGYDFEYVYAEPTYYRNRPVRIVREVTPVRSYRRPVCTRCNR